MSTHARLSPSSAHRWLHCPASVSLEADFTDSSGVYAAEGTAAHFLAEHCLADERIVAGHLHYWISVDANGECKLLPPFDAVSAPIDGYVFKIDRDTVGFVDGYVERIRSLTAALNGVLFVEQKLPIDHLTGETGATGTADAVILSTNELVVCDLKYGQGVMVDADHNEQLMMYALAALEHFAWFGDFDNVRLIVDQPRKAHISEWAISTDELHEFAQQVRTASKRISTHASEANPSSKACKWCKAKAKCAALTDAVNAEVSQDFDDLTAVSDGDIASKYAKLDMVKAWAEAVQKEAYKRMLQGEQLDGYKLVAGRKGTRKWSDTAQAEALLKKMRVKRDDMYDKKLISPATAEKLAKSGVISKRQYPKLQQLITQSEGKPVIAPETDKRTALDLNPASDFDDLTAA